MNDFKWKIDSLYRNLDYLEAYSKHTDLRVQISPVEAIGGLWEEIGQLQLDFLLSVGLQPEHSFLDIGCGTLRGGRLIIPYLNPGNYFGTDISSEAIKYARTLVQNQGLETQRPTLHIDDKRVMQFERIGLPSYDYVFAQSVFTHLKRKHVEQLVSNLQPIFSCKTRFFFTFLEAPMHEGESHKDFYHQCSFFKSLSNRFGYAYTNHTHSYPHPRGHRMIEYSAVVEPE